MWSKGLEYKKREKEKLSKIDSKNLPFDVFVKNGELVSWRRNGSWKRTYQFYKKSCNRNFRRSKNIEIIVKGNHYRKYFELQYAWI